MAGIPIVFQEVLNLTSPPVSAAADAVKFGSCSMESSKYITVCEPAADGTQVLTVDLSAGNAPSRQKINAEAAIMHPSTKVIALRSGNVLQIFNLELRTKMKSHQMSEPVQFWCWISTNQIALVTAGAVYHWSIESDSVPSKVFEKNAALAQGSQIINYSVSPDMKWCLLAGISAGAGGAINGTLQLYSIERGVSQILKGHSGAFGKINVSVAGRDTPTAQVVCFEQKEHEPGSTPKLMVLEIGRDKTAPGGVFRIQPMAIPVPPDAALDFPVSMILSTKQEIIYSISKMGYLHMYDVHTGKVIYMARVTNDTTFVATENASTGGLMAITRKGSVIHINVNEQTLVPYIIGTLRDQDLALSLAGRLNLSGADDLYVSQFQACFAAGDIAGAARVASNSPGAVLRNSDTISKFQGMPAQPGQPAPVFQYFSVLLEKGKLNQLETIELAKPVLQQGRGQMLSKWIEEDKLFLSEQFGDLIMSTGDANMALPIYVKSNSHDKVISCLVQQGEFDKIVAYAGRVGHRADYSVMLQQLVRSNPQGAMEFAKKLVNNESKQTLIDPTQALEIFMGFSLLKEATGFLIEVLKDDKQSEGFLQTKLLEINLMGGMPQVADAILSNGTYTHYDKAYIGKLCEQVGLSQRALEHYSDISDIKRVMQSNPQGVSPDFLVDYFGSLSKENSLDVLKEMLGRNMRQNMKTVVNIATKYSDPLGPENLIQLFEDFKCWEGIFFYLGNVVNFSQNATVHKKYIESAAKMGNFKEVERVCRDSTVYDAAEVKQFLIEAKLPDPRPLIHVCDRHDYVDELTAYLHTNNLQKYIEVYVTKVSPQKTPQVVGKLLDLETNEDFIKNLINSVGQMCPAADLVVAVEKRNRLRLILPWLEARLAQGNQETAVHNAVGKIYISLNRDPLTFLSSNQFYDPLEIGKYCEKHDPHLAFVAYKGSKDFSCDKEIVRVCQDNGLFKDLARYLVERQDLDLWGSVLKPEGIEEGTEPPSRRYLLDQVVQTALPETKNPDEVSSTVKAFMANDLPGELVELLERIVLQGSDFSNNRNLQNLLILTAIKTTKEKVMEYINRLDNFDGDDIAKIAVGDEYQLFEEAYSIYVKIAKLASGEEQITHHVSAVSVLVDHIKDLERANEYAERVSLNAVWSKVASAQLSQDLVCESITSFIKADDPTDWLKVIDAAESAGHFTELVSYLKMARKNIKEAHLDTQLIYALAKVNKLSDMEELISVPNVAKIDIIGERCFDEAMYDAAKILFTNINNNAKLALCFVRMEQYREATDAATKANSVPTWKEVNLSCLRAEEFRLANICGLHIIVHPDHLEELIGHYETAGRSVELMQLLEQGLGLDNAHAGIFTELGVIYSKYQTSKLMEHIKIFHSKMNIVKILRACEKAQLWTEAVYLYKEDGQHDAAVKVMVDHVSSFKHELFLDCVQKVRNPEVQYKAITFYCVQHPMQLERLLQVLTPNLDHARVVHLLRKNNALELSIEYLKSVQKENLTVINEALNEMYIDEEDHEALRSSIDDYDNFDQIALAQKAEKHELLEFRRIAAYIYKRNKRYSQSVELSKKDKMMKDAIDTAADSKETKVADSLLAYFVEIGDKSCFSATLYSCFDLLTPDAVMEHAWRNGLTDMAMPFMIQYMKNLHSKVKVLEERTAPPPVEETATDEANAALYGTTGDMMGDTLMIQNGGGYSGGAGAANYGAPGSIPDPYQQQQFGYQQQQQQQQQQMPNMSGFQGQGAQGYNYN
jgi:clathrin heavy chain